MLSAHLRLMCDSVKVKYDIQALLICNIAMLHIWVECSVVLCHQVHSRLHDCSVQAFLYMTDITCASDHCNSNRSACRFGNAQFPQLIPELSLHADDFYIPRCNAARDNFRALLFEHTQC